MSQELPFTVAPIASDRLDLVWMSPALIEALLAGRPGVAEALLEASLPAGWPDEYARDRLKLYLAQMACDRDSAQWLLRAMVQRNDREVVGVINFHAAPNAKSQVELGYMVFEPHRRRGYATEAATAMIRWASAEQQVRRFLVVISPANGPSLAMAAKLGFRRIGSQIDEVDGEEYVFELRLEVPAVLRLRGGRHLEIHADSGCSRVSG